MSLSAEERKKIKTSDFGLSDVRKFPLINKQTVMSAIKLFTNCPPKRKKELALKIYKKAKQFGVYINSSSMVYNSLPEEYQKKIDKDNKLNEAMKQDIDVYDFIPVSVNEINRILNSTPKEKIFISSDLHFMKVNEKEDEEKIKAHNKVVKDDCVFIFLGDATQDDNDRKEELKNYLKKLNKGKFSIFVRGNNDIYEDSFYLKECGFDIFLKGFIYQDYVFTHAPIRNYNNISKKINIHGHLHDSNYYYPTKFFDPSESYVKIYNKKNKWTPFSFKEIIDEINNKSRIKEKIKPKEALLVSELISVDSNDNIVILTNNVNDYMSKFNASNKLITLYMKSNNLEGIKQECSKLFFMHIILTDKYLNKKDLPLAEYNEYKKINAFLLNGFSRGIKFILENDSSFIFETYFQNTEYYPYCYKINPKVVSVIAKLIRNVIEIFHIM